MPLQIASLQVCDVHWGGCLCRLHFFGEHHYPWECDNHWKRRFFSDAVLWKTSQSRTPGVPDLYIGDGAFHDKLHVVSNRHIWLYWFATVGTWFFTFELAPMGQCSPSDQLSIITNSRAKKMATMCFGIGKSTQLLQLNYPAHKSHIDWYMYPYGLPSATIPYLHLSPSFAWQPVRTSWDTM